MSELYCNKLILDTYANYSTSKESYFHWRGISEFNILVVTIFLTLDMSSLSYLHQQAIILGFAIAFPWQCVEVRFAGFRVIALFTALFGQIA